MKYEVSRIISTPFSLLFRLLSDRKSLEACAVIAGFILILDFIFHTYLFSQYQSFLASFLDLEKKHFENLDLGVVPIVWVAVLAFIFGTLVIVITFAAQNIPKLIDLYMDEWWSLLFLWFIIGGGVHILILKLFHEAGSYRDSSIILNIHFLGVIGFITFPYTFHVLASTKPQRVIEQILASSRSIFNELARQPKLKNRKSIAKYQYTLFEMLNQLDDLLVFVPFKEPKADIIQGVGQTIALFVEKKSLISPEVFKISPRIREDISFKTLESQLEDVEIAHTFYEQKGFRLIGNAYHTLITTNQFDLATLCSAQLGLIGEAAIRCNDRAIIELVMIRFNTHFRHALKHGQRYNEPRNLYNLVFHYGLFVRALVRENAVEHVKTCFFYLRFYSVECFKNALTSQPLAFILDTIAAEMAKLMELIHENQWDLKIQEELLNDFLLLDNPAGVDRREVAEFFISQNSVRVLQIGLGLFYLEKNMDEFANKVVHDTLQDLELMDQEYFFKVMTGVFNRLRYSGPKFWEDTDRGNLNIYYTPYANQIEKFENLQKSELHKKLINLQKLDSAATS